MKKFFQFFAGMKRRENERHIRHYRNNNIELYIGWQRHFPVRLTYETPGFLDDQERPLLIVSFLFFAAYILFPFKTSPWVAFEEPPEWGFYIYPEGRAFVVKWGKKTKYFYFPWCLEFYQKGYMLKNGQWGIETRKEYRHPSKYEKEVMQWKANYSYTTTSGEKQNCVATVTQDFMVWRWRWFMWLPWPRLKKNSIWVEFSREMGERCGSWKGGTIGCGYDLLPGETPLQCLARMEKERKL